MTEQLRIFAAFSSQPVRVVGAGSLLPEDSAARMALFVAGGIPVGLAMVAFPAWWLVVASTAR